MARVKDLWFATVKTRNADGKTVSEKRKTARHPDRGGNKKAKRWLACWNDPDGKEVTKACATQEGAKQYAKKQEADADRGEYIAPKAGREKFGALAQKTLRLRKIGASSRRRYESAYTNHIEPVFADRSVKSIKPSELLEWLLDLGSHHGHSTQEICYLIVCATFDLAVADSLRHDNPARSPIIPKPRAETKPRDSWSAARIWLITDAQPEPYRTVPVCAAGLGLRQAEAFALAEEDFDFEAGKAIIRRQVVRLGGLWVFKMPKGGKERTVPVSRGVSVTVQAQIEAYPPQPYTLPWMGEDGELHGEHTCKILFRWHGDDPRSHGKHIPASSYDQSVWKPALHAAGIIGPAVRDKSGVLRYPADRQHGMHNERHYFSTTLLDAGVSLAGVMEFMGHSRKGVPVTLGVYGHVTEETFEQARQAIDRNLFKLRPVSLSGTMTELRSAR